MPKIFAAGAFAAAALLFASGCHDRGGEAMASPGARAICDLASTGQGSASGRVVFTQRLHTTHIDVMMQGLTPGKHGIHIHERGDCGNSGKNAGEHFNPQVHEHGKAAHEESPLGDLGNITADKDGRASLSLDDPYLSLEGADSILGRAVVVHADPDDLKTQPSGNSGSRIACGVIYGAPR